MQLTLPTYPYQIKKEGGKLLIQSQITKHWLIMTPEEWVRQHWVAYLTGHLLIPSTLIAMEKQWIVDNKKFRIDLGVFDSSGNLDMLVELKSPMEKMADRVGDQVSAYAQLLSYAPRYIIASNGVQHFTLQQGQLEALDIYTLPKYKSA